MPTLLDPPAPSPEVSYQDHQQKSNETKTAAAQDKQVPQPQTTLIKARPSQIANIQTEAKKADEHSGSSADWTIAGATIVLAAVTAILAAFTYKLWRSTKDLVSGADKANKATERAYIFVEVAIAESLIGFAAPKEFLFKVSFLNQGKTPAEIVKLRGYMEFRDFSDGPPHELIHWNGAEIELPVGIGIAGNAGFVDDFRKALGPQETKQLRSMEKMLYAVGRITYRDIFNRIFETSFCWQYFHHSETEKFILTRESKLNHRT